MKKIIYILLGIIAGSIITISLNAQSYLQLPYSVQVLNPKPLDGYYYNGSFTPYTGTAQVNSQIPSGVRYRGMTVNISGVEYWYGAGILNTDLVVKFTAGGGITNTAANNEIPKSNGTNIVPSGIFSSSLGNLQLGTGLGAGNRVITAQNGTLQFDATSGGGNYDFIGSNSTLTYLSGSNLLRMTNNIGIASAFEIRSSQGSSTSTIGKTLQLTGGPGYSTGVTNGGPVQLSGGAPNSTGTYGGVFAFSNTTGLTISDATKTISTNVSSGASNNALSLTNIKTLNNVVNGTNTGTYSLSALLGQIVVDDGTQSSAISISNTDWNLSTNNGGTGELSADDITITPSATNPGFLIITNLPVSCAGAPSGAIWNNLGILSICP